MKVEALRLREGNWLSGVRSKESSWPWAWGSGTLILI